MSQPSAPTQPSATPLPPEPWGEAPFDSSGTNMFGVKSPIATLSGGDRTKAAQLSQYYKNLAKTPGIHPGLAAKIRGMFDPNGTTSADIAAFEDYKLDWQKKQAQQQGMLAGIYQNAMQSQMSS